MTAMDIQYVLYSGAREKRIHEKTLKSKNPGETDSEKTLKSKISCQTPFNILEKHTKSNVLTLGEFFLCTEPICHPM